MKKKKAFLNQFFAQFFSKNDLHFLCSKTQNHVLVRLRYVSFKVSFPERFSFLTKTSQVHTTKAARQAGRQAGRPVGLASPALQACKQQGRTQLCTPRKTKQVLISYLCTDGGALGAPWDPAHIILPVEYQRLFRYTDFASLHYPQAKGAASEPPTCIQSTTNS